MIATSAGAPIVAAELQSTDVALLVAVAGGVGVFLGTVVGQVIQGFRDRAQRRVEDRRRRDDLRVQLRRERRDRAHEIDAERREHRRAAYVALIGHCAQMADCLMLLRLSVPDFAEMERNAIEAGTFTWDYAKRKWDENVQRPVAAAAGGFELALSYASSDVVEAFRVLDHSSSTLRHPFFDNPTGFFLTVVRSSDRLGLKPSKREVGTERDEQLLKKSIELCEQVAVWTLDQLRSELHLGDQAAPEPLPFRPALYE